MWAFYILYSAKLNRYYVGVTGDDLIERLRKHNSNHKGFTGNVNDWKTVYSELYRRKENAFARERKSRNGRAIKMIEALIRSAHSD